MQQAVRTIPTAPSTPGAAVIDLTDAALGAGGPTVIAARHEAVHAGHLRTARMWAVVALALLNAADLLTTAAFIRRGGVEGNPVAEVLMGSGMHGAVKAAVVCALGWRAYHAPATLRTTAAMWAAVGFYVCVICVNSMTIAALS